MRFLKQQLTLRHLLIDLLALCAVFASLAWIMEGDMGREYVLGTGLGAAAIALAYFYLDHRHGSRSQR